MRILVVSDAWFPQVNGVVRTLSIVADELEAQGHALSFVTPDLFPSVPCPTYPEIRLAIAPAAIVHSQLMRPYMIQLVLVVFGMFTLARYLGPLTGSGDGARRGGGSVPSSNA